MKNTSALCILVFTFFCSGAQVLTQVDSIQFTQAQIWGVLSDEGDSLCATTTFTPGSKPHIYMRKIDYNNISQQSALKQLTFDNDFTSITNLTDHKHIVLNNEIYVAFSTQGDQDLFIFKTDINGNRIGSIVPVVQGSADPTNDMILTTDSTYIYVLHFDPPGQSHVYTFDTGLNPVGSPFSTTTLPHNNIGNAIMHNGQFHMFTGNIFGFNSNLTLTRWTASWAPATGSPQTILSSTNGDGNWFSTGEVYDYANQRWYIAMSHIETPQTIGQEHIDVLVFDNNFNLLQRIHETSQNYLRPHLVLEGNYLYMAYDRPGNSVHLVKYQVSPASGTDEPEDSEASIYPNPASDEIGVGIKGVPEMSFELMDASGRIVKAGQLQYGGKIAVSTLVEGIYFLKIMYDGSVLTRKVIISRAI